MSQLFNDERRLKDKHIGLGVIQADRMRRKDIRRELNMKEGYKEWVSHDVR